VGIGAKWPQLTKNLALSICIFKSFPYICPPKFKKNMANHKATKKDVRQSAKRRERNRYYGKTTRNAIRDLRAVTDAAAAGEQLPEVASMIDKLAKRGVIHKNKAANLKSKLARRVNTLATAK
jgi:small subunit ribosomal protein S20